MAAKTKFYPCPKGPDHVSSDPEFCSECGARIVNATGAIAALPPQTSKVGSASCPDCGTPRSGKRHYCEVCRYDFESGTSFTPSSSASARGSSKAAGRVRSDAAKSQSRSSSHSRVHIDPQSSRGSDQAETNPELLSPAPSRAQPAASSDGSVRLTPNASRKKFDAVVRVNPSLYKDPDPRVPIPEGEPERVFPLDFEENVVGRRSTNRGTYPELPLNDPGISHRHLKLLVEDLQIFLLDLGSTNGTQLNGVDVAAGVKTSVKLGESITLGCWTEIVIKER